MTARWFDWKVYQSDPGREGLWWWLGVPAALSVFLVVSHAVSPSFYRAYILPEGYGFLELGHFLIPLVAAVIALRAMARVRRNDRLMATLLALFGLGCIYIAGEEHSWGQHIFNWSTPEYWAQINRQQETNFHNMSSWFNHKPWTALEIGMIVGGLAAPLMLARLLPHLPARLLVLVPNLALLPTLAGYALFKVKATLDKKLDLAMAVVRPAEATETFIYLFLMFYIIILSRRLEAGARPLVGAGRQQPHAG